MAFWLICHLAELNVIDRDYYISLIEMIEITCLNITPLNGSDADSSVYFARLESSRLTSVLLTAARSVCMCLNSKRS